MQYSYRPDDLTLPFPMKQRTFRRHEHIIRKAVETSPTPVYVTPPANIAATTLCGRLRDSLLSLYRYQWAVDFDYNKFVKLYETRQLKVKGPVENQVMLGPATESFDIEKVGDLVSHHSSSAAVPTWVNPTQADLNALLHLLGRRHLVGPYRLTALTSDLRAAILLAETQYDIAVTTINDHTVEVL